jgi:cation transport ATPase
LQKIIKKERKYYTMKKTYKIEVDCANCANLMEDAAKKTEGVKDCVVNFMTQKMIVEFNEGAADKDVMKAVLKNCKKVEEDCEIYL